MSNRFMQRWGYVLAKIPDDFPLKEAWPGGKEQLQEIKGALRTLRDQWRAAAEWLTLELNEVDEALIAHYAPLRALFKQAQDRYKTFKEDRPALDFDDLEARAVALLRDAKTRLQEWAHAQHRCTPSYRTVHDSGTDNDEQRFTVEVLLGDRILGRGIGRSKRAAERAAAEEALAALPESELAPSRDV